MAQPLQQFNNTCIAALEKEISTLSFVGDRVGVNVLKGILSRDYGLEVAANRLRLQLKSMGYVVKATSLTDNGYVEI